MELNIKNMVCDRCIFVVTEILEKLDIPFKEVTLGKIFFPKELESSKKAQLQEELKHLGFEVLINKKAKIAEQIKNNIIAYLNLEIGEEITQNLSAFLHQKLDIDYKVLSSIFLEMENQTIGQYYAALKIEKVKEYILYNEMSISQISDLFNYSSLAHLSKQFKQIAGLSPSEFKIKNIERKALDKI